MAGGQVVTVLSGGTVAVAKNITNAGTITVGSAASASSTLSGPTVTLTNSGQLNTVESTSAGFFRDLLVNITNAPSGTIDVGAAATRQTGGGGPTTLTNNGTVTVRAGKTLALSGGSSFAQTACATFAPTIDANTAAFGRLTGGGGSVSLDGLLRVNTVGSPALSSNWAIISNASRSGEFALLDFGTTTNYDVQYLLTGVTLVASAQTPPPSPVLPCFQVFKDFSDDSTATVNVSLTCTSGTVTPTDSTASEADPPISRSSDSPPPARLARHRKARRPRATLRTRAPVRTSRSALGARTVAL